MAMRLAVLLIATGASVVNTSAADPSWTGWLGPNRDGHVTGFEAPGKWPTQLSRKWQVKVGTGYGSPLVHEGRVYQHGRLDGREVLTCVSLETGSQVWQAGDETPFKMGGGGEWHGKGPKSCPVMADGRIFTLSISGTLTARKITDGSRLWRRNYDKEFGKSHPYWGASSSPVVDGSRVIMRFGTDDAGVLVALDAVTGKEVWKLEGPGASYSSPLAVTLHGVRQIIDWNHDTIIGVESATGKLLWRHPFPHVGHNQNMPTPTFHGDRILLGAENRGLHCLIPERSQTGWRVSTGWMQKKIALDMSSAVHSGDLLYGMSHYQKGQLFAVNITNGNILWTSEGRQGQNATFLTTDGYVFVLLDNGRLKLLSSEGTNTEVLRSWKVADSPTWAPPVLLPDGLLIKDQETLNYLTF